MFWFVSLNDHERILKLISMRNFHRVLIEWFNEKEWISATRNNSLEESTQRNAWISHSSDSCFASLAALSEWSIRADCAIREWDITILRNRFERWRWGPYCSVKKIKWIYLIKYRRLMRNSNHALNFILFLDEYAFATYKN